MLEPKDQHEAALGTAERREMEAEELLKRLLEFFCVSSYGWLEWPYIEGITIRVITDDDFELALLPYLDEKKAAALRKVHGA